MPKAPKVSIKEKIRLVRLCISGEMGVLEAAREAGVHHKTISRWMVRYEADGVDGLLPQEKNRVYNPGLKKKAVEEYLSGQGSLLAVSRRHKISNPCLLEAWIKVYNAHGDLNSVKHSGGGSYMKQGRETTQEERIQIAKECYASGKNYGEMALKYNVSYQQVRNWTLRYEELGEAGLEDRRGQRKKDQAARTPLEEAQIEIERLKHELHKAEMERDLLKKLDEVVRRDAYRK